MRFLLQFHTPLVYILLTALAVYGIVGIEKSLRRRSAARQHPASPIET
jgi:hypothetical protein